MGAQALQDEFVLSLIDKGTFIDIGCYMPENLNNTYMLEQKGWTGIAIDIKDFSEQWKDRTTPFICADSLECDYTDMLKGFPDVIDYLSIDIEGDGDRFKTLERVFESGHEFRIITIEHDVYKIPERVEAGPQRDFLTANGYYLLCKNVKADTRPFEDWWVNPKYLKGYEHYKSCNLHCGKIMKLRR